jgi:hypothetical protein
MDQIRYALLGSDKQKLALQEIYDAIEARVRLELLSSVDPSDLCVAVPVGHLAGTAPWG